MSPKGFFVSFFSFVLFLLSFLSVADIASCNEEVLGVVALTRRPASLFHPSALSKRVVPDHMWDGLFEPTSSVVLDYIGEDYETTPQNIYTFILSHNESRYVDLEQLEMLLKPQERICSPPTGADNLTQLTLPFLEIDAFHAARQNWETRSNLLFVLEDESCFEGRGPRSMYKPRTLDFVEEFQTVVINGTPVDDLSADWASTVRIINHPAADTPDDVKLTTRLRRRENIFKKGWRKAKEVGHGLKEAGKDGKDTLENLTNTGVDTGKTVWHDVEKGDWEEIPGDLEDGASQAKDDVVDGWEDIKDDLRDIVIGGHLNHTFSVSEHHDLGDRKMIAGRYGNVRAWSNLYRTLTKFRLGALFPIPSIYCIECYIHADLVGYYDFEFDLNPLNKDGENSHGIGRVIKSAKAGIKAVRRVEARLQLEAVISLGADIFCHIPIPYAALVGPLPGDVCSLGYYVNNVLLDAPLSRTPYPFATQVKAYKDYKAIKAGTKEPDPYPKGTLVKAGPKPPPPGSVKPAKTLSAKNFELFGNSVGLFIFLNIGVAGEVNITFPGFRWSMEEGATVEIDLLHEDKVQVDIPGELEILPPRIGVQNLNVHAAVSLRAKISGGINHPRLPNSMFGLLAALDLARLDVKLDEPQDVDEHCNKGGPFKRALGFWLWFRSGFYATFSLGPINFDTNMLAAMAGLENLGYSTNPDKMPAAPFNFFVPLYAHCFEVDKGVAGRINLGLQKMVDKLWPKNLKKTFGSKKYTPDQGATKMEQTSAQGAPDPPS